MARLYGWGEKPSRVEEYVPDVRFERSSLIAGVRLSGVIAPISFRGSLNGEFFEGYVEQVLAPILKPGDIVVMDNYSVHKVAVALDAIAERGASVLFLPPYSPDYNPIEMMWSKVKSILRKIKASTH
jgi:transposase